MRDSIKVLFIVSLVGFIFLGMLLVIGQALGLVVQSEMLIMNSKEYLSTFAFTLSAIAAVLGFILQYIKE